MLLPEAPLETLIEQLATLPAGDRRAILARLSRSEREAVRRASGRPSRPVSPFSADIAARIAAGNEAPITTAARDALNDALGTMPASQPASGSLLDVFGGLLARHRPV